MKSRIKKSPCRESKLIPPPPTLFDLTRKGALGVGNYLNQLELGPKLLCYLLIGKISFLLARYKGQTIKAF